MTEEEALASGARTAPTWSVRELSDAIGEQLQAAFPTEVWVRGEIQNLNRARSGHVYFTLCDHDGDGEAAQLSVMLSASARVRVNRLLLRNGGRVRMTDGTEVRIRGRLDWYGPRGQLQLRMASIDPAFTLGQLAAARAELLARLRDEGLLERNRTVPFPLLPLRIGLVTSVGSAAEADVLHELERSGFRFEVTVADVRVQGAEAPAAIAAAVAGLDRTRIDVIVVARGGGAANDLAAFDSELVARAIASATRPVVTGVGHEIDRSVADDVAHTQAKTPTAAAQLLVGVVAAALERAEDAWHRLVVRAEHVLTQSEERLDRHRARAGVAARTAAHREAARIQQSAHRLARSGRTVLDRAEHQLATGERRLSVGAHRALREATGTLEVLEARVRANDPARALERGWSLTRRTDGTLVRSVADLAPGTKLETTVADGTVTTTVVEVHDRSPDQPTEDQG